MISQEKLSDTEKNNMRSKNNEQMREVQSLYMQFPIPGLPSYLHRKLSWLAHVGYQSPSEVEGVPISEPCCHGALLQWVQGKYCVTMSPLHVNFSPR